MGCFRWLCELHLDLLSVLPLFHLFQSIFEIFKILLTKNYNLPSWIYHLESWSLIVASIFQLILNHPVHPKIKCVNCFSKIYYLPFLICCSYFFHQIFHVLSLSHPAFSSINMILRLRGLWALKYSNTHGVFRLKIHSIWI